MQRPLHRQFERCAEAGDGDKLTSRCRLAHTQRFGFNAVQDIHNAPILQPGLIIQKTTQLLRQLGHRALGMFTGFEPVVMDASATDIRPEFSDGRQGQDRFQQIAEFILPRAGHQEVPEGAEAAPLVGIVDDITLTHDLLKQVTLATFP